MVALLRETNGHDISRAKDILIAVTELLSKLAAPIFIVFVGHFALVTKISCDFLAE